MIDVPDDIKAAAAALLAAIAAHPKTLHPDVYRIAGNVKKLT